jgi:uncharacterized protein YndB with AHSA1/START domain
MLIREDVITRATPERAWELISDPSLHDLWNSHIVSTEVPSTERPAQGLRYRVTYELSGRRNEFDAEITEFSPPHRFVARLEERVKGDGKNWERFAVESYVLTPRGSTTHVRHEVRIEHAGEGVLIRLLVWLISRFGKPTGKPFMERFRELAEDDAPPTKVARS